MLSRVADSIYWMQRYLERAENIASLIDVNMLLSIDAPGDDEQQWHPIVVTTGDFGLFEQLYGKPTEKNVIEFLTFDTRNPNSIINCVYRSRENARSVRESITLEMWHELNSLHIFMQQAAIGLRKDIKSLYEFYARIKRSCQLFTGIMDTTLSHDEAWHFGRLGNLLERADQSSRILDTKYFMLLPSVEHVGTAYDDILWSALLRSVSGLEMYRRIWHEIRHSHVIDFIVLNREFPRSIHSCLWRAKQSLMTIGYEPVGNGIEPPIVLVDRLCTELATTTVYDIVKIGLHEYLDQIQSKISQISQSLYTAYFAPFQEPPTDASNEVLINMGGRSE
jgi:uncharacterized alpha-E superfamily protein